MEIRELRPCDGRKSFYGKARVEIENGVETLYSYDTPVLRRRDGVLERLYDGWTATTERHIKAFCGLDKAGFMRLACRK